MAIRIVSFLLRGAHVRIKPDNFKIVLIILFIIYIKFNVKDHELVSFNIKAMYPNINVTRTVSYIIATIFRDPIS